LRFGPGYARFVEEYNSRESFFEDDWKTWQRHQLQKLLNISAAKVPYYRETWSQSEKQAASSGNLIELPLLEKEAIRAAPEALLRDDMQPRPKLTFHTSGSTGTPIATFWTIQELRESLALREVRSARWAGVSFQMPRGTFSGRIVEPDPDSPGPFYRYNCAERQVYLSAFHLRSDTAHQYISALRKHQVRWLTGYAVSFYLLAKFVLEQELQVPPLMAVITTSEKVTSKMRQVMELAYQCRVYEEFSTVENVIFASECQQGSLHISPDVGIVEILRSDGTPCKPDEVGEVVVTSLTRSYQPFIRYRLGDLAAWSSKGCSCGRSMPVIKEVVGRVEDVVIGPDGRRLVRFHGIFVDQPHVQEGQIIQEDLDLIRVKIVPAKGYSQADEWDILQRVKQRLGNQVKVVIEPTPCIPRTSSGKFQAVISKLHQKGFAEAERTGIG